MARLLARRHGVGITEAIRDALKEKLERDDRKPSLAERIKPIQDRIASYPATVLKADRAFWNEMTGEEE